MFAYKYPPPLRDERFFPVEWDEIPEQRALSADDYVRAAKQFRIPLAHLRALVAVEAAGSGFLLTEPPPSRPKILFERHVFYRLTPLPVSKHRPDLSYKNWDASAYKGGSAEWDRLRDAMAFDPENALKSASWGLGQVMGFNHVNAGCATIQQFVEECFSGEAAQLRHMLRFIEAGNMMGLLRTGSWTKFAERYNGPGYAKNSYHTKLAAAARRFANV